MSEWANFRGLDISARWSPRGGQTLGVYYPDSSPSGSSSGSAVAVALGLSVAALGTEVRLLLSLLTAPLIERLAELVSTDNGKYPCACREKQRRRPETFSRACCQ